MNILEKVSAQARSMVQPLIDKEAVNYVESGVLYGIVMQGRYHVSFLSILHNHARDSKLRHLIKEALDELSEVTIVKCEDLLRAGDAQVPAFDLPVHSLDDKLDIPSNARLSDAEIAMALVTMDAAAQAALLSSIHQCYQLEISLTLRNQLNKGLDWSYTLLQLMLDRGWLPKIAKVEH